MILEKHVEYCENEICAGDNGVLQIDRSGPEATARADSTGEEEWREARVLSLIHGFIYFWHTDVLDCIHDSLYVNFPSKSKMNQYFDFNPSSRVIFTWFFGWEWRRTSFKSDFLDDPLNHTWFIILQWK